MEIGIIIATIIVLLFLWKRQVRWLEERFKGLTEYGMDMILTFKQDGLITYQSPSLTRILGYAPGELLRTSVFDLFHKADGANWERVLTATLNRKSSQSFKHQIRHKQGHYLDVESHWVNMLDNKALKAIVLNIRDMTGHKQLQQELQQVKRTVDMANQARREFLFTISHELRTPLNAILGYTQLLRQDKGLMDKQREAIETIHRSGEQLLTLLNGLSDFFRVETQEIECQDSERKVLVEEARSNLSAGSGSKTPIEKTYPENDQRESSRNGGTSPKRYIHEHSSPLADAGWKILVVDDNDQNRAFVKDILAPLGFEIMEAVDGREALGAVKGFHPDVILMDLVMPGMDGLETIRRIRQIPEFKKVIVIGISASVYDTTKEESFMAGCDDFLTKPFQIEEILNCLRVHLGVEWNYAGTIEVNHENSQASETISLVTPPQEFLRELLESAESGCITDIRKSITKMREFDRNLIPFASRIEQLTEDFQFEQIIESIKSYLMYTEAK